MGPRGGPYQRASCRLHLASCLTVACAVAVTAATAAVARGQTLGPSTSPREAFAAGLAAFDQAQAIRAEDSDWARALYRQAAMQFEQVAAEGIVNGRLEYNLGNCYLQAGDIGRAILHYRRAQRLIPGDPLLEANLKEAQSRRLTIIEPRGRSSLLRAVFFLHFTTPLQVRLRLALVAYAAFWVSLALRSFVRQRHMGIAALLAGLAAVSLGTSAGIDVWKDRNAPAGVITTMDVVAYKGPGAGYQRQFEQPLQPGVEFTLRARRGDWWHVELPDGKTGWIAADSGALVPAALESPG